MSHALRRLARRFGRPVAYLGALTLLALCVGWGVYTEQATPLMRAVVPLSTGCLALLLVVLRSMLIRSSEARFRRITDMAADIVYRVRLEPRLKLEYVNPAFQKVLGYTPEQLQGDLACFLDGAITPESVVPWLEDLASEGLQTFTWQCRTASGEDLWLETRFSVVREALGGLVLEGLARDVTEQRRTQNSLIHQAHHDPLTGVSNRASFDNALEAMVERCTPDMASFALLYVDLDGFKGVNDTMGHDAGDTVLKAVSGRLRHALREHDQIFRLGGDEFAVIVSQLDDPKHPQRVADRIVGRVEEPIGVTDGVARVGASVGVALFPQDGIRSDDLLRFADVAMYKAKRRGGGRSVRYADWRRGVCHSEVFARLDDSGELELPDHEVGS